MQNIFISHWAGESSLALLFKEWIENIFDKTNVFVSSSEKNIDFGEKWEDTMMDALQRANVVIILVSKKSYNRKWIHIETGFCLARELKLIIVRIDDLLPEEMGRPYDNYQSFPISSPLFTKTFFQALSFVLGKNLRENIGYDYMQMTINQKAKEMM